MSAKKKSKGSAKKPRPTKTKKTEQLTAPGFEQSEGEKGRGASRGPDRDLDPEARATESPDRVDSSEREDSISPTELVAEDDEAAPESSDDGSPSETDDDPAEPDEAESGAVRPRAKKARKIKEAADLIGIKPHVLRYWEREFPSLNPKKGGNGRRIYTEKDIELARRIKSLLYEDEYSISGARKRLARADERRSQRASTDDRAKKSLESLRADLTDILETFADND